ncbi:hypothetical protein [Haloarchaeobius litoreus]|uniref:Uncharacterized protein n=1 Tax=Haloarchaeobius litoreus TaxID=755306 RepID=A0ABD6DHG2_9EURY|nr:hypothetical protein [Haloarchaeobius litoreus]
MNEDGGEAAEKVHPRDEDRLSYLPDELRVDGEPLGLRRFTDDEGHTVGSEWVYTDDETTERLDSRDFERQSTHCGSERKRIKHPFQAMSEVDITLRSERADRWNEAMDEPADRPGYRPPRPAALGIILASWDDEYGGLRARGGTGLLS